MDNGRAWSSSPISLFKLCRVAFIFSLLLGPISCTSRRHQFSLNDEEGMSSLSTVVLPMPSLGHQGIPHNDYRCTTVSLPADTRYIIGYEPRADVRVVHHMILFGCKSRVQKGSWDCMNNHDICNGNDEAQVLFSWALNASGLTLPPDVGFKVGFSSKVNNLVVQIHYEVMATVDISDMTSVSNEALAVYMTKQRQKFVAGIYLIGSSDSISPGMRQTFVDAACTFPGPKSIYPFAFRTHSHLLGKQIVGYLVKPGGKWEMIGNRSPQDPQAFYPVTKTLQVDPHDQLALRCVYNTENRMQTIHMGPNSKDEMCNFYIMYYTINDARKLVDDSCWTRPAPSMKFPAKLPPLHSNAMTPPDHAEDEQKEVTSIPIPISRSNSNTLPMSTSAPHHSQDHGTLPPPPPPHSGFGLVLSEDWPLNSFSIPKIAIGQVTAAAVDAAGDLHVLHRGPVTWEYDSFSNDHTYRHILNGPIKVATIIHFSSSGQPQHAWGSNFFYMPHGLTIDHEGSFWVTDTALHQVFKFLVGEDTKPNLVLGKAFEPGQDYKSFCQPTSVAVERSGDFYVTDGYCNHRVMKFSSKGTLLDVWESSIEGKELFIPHKAILNAADTMLYVADRENQRIVLYDTLTGSGKEWSGKEELDGSPYAISFNSFSAGGDWYMHGVFGGIRKDGESLMGFTLNMNGKKMGTWGPDEGFTQPHDLTMDMVHHAVYVTEIGPNRIWKFVPYPHGIHHISSDLENFLNSTSEDVPIATSSHEFPADNSSTPGIEEVIFDLPTDNSNTSGIGEGIAKKDSDDMKSIAPNRQPSVVYAGIIVTIVAVIALAVIITVGVLTEYKYIRFKGWFCQNGTTIDVKPRRTTIRKEREEDTVPVKTKKKKKKITPYSRLHSVLGPSKLGFSRLRTYDSDSEEEEFPVFNRV